MQALTKTSMSVNLYMLIKQSNENAKKMGRQICMILVIFFPLITKFLKKDLIMKPGRFGYKNIAVLGQ